MAVAIAAEYVDAGPVAETQETIEAIIRGIVDIPEVVAVTALEGQQAAVFEVSVDPSDVRRVIGAQGKMADSIRCILATMGAKAGMRFRLEILEPVR